MFDIFENLKEKVSGFIDEHPSVSNFMEQGQKFGEKTLEKISKALDNLAEADYKSQIKKEAQKYNVSIDVIDEYYKKYCGVSIEEYLDARKEANKKIVSIDDVLSARELNMNLNEYLFVKEDAQKFNMTIKECLKMKEEAENQNLTIEVLLENKEKEWQEKQKAKIEREEQQKREMAEKKILEEQQRKLRAEQREKRKYALKKSNILLELVKSKIEQDNSVSSYAMKSAVETNEDYDMISAVKARMDSTGQTIKDVENEEISLMLNKIINEVLDIEELVEEAKKDNKTATDTKYKSSELAEEYLRKIGYRVFDTEERGYTEPTWTSEGGSYTYTKHNITW